jgi:hypothetical protein
MLLGLLALMLMPVDIIWRVASSTPWLFFCGHELRVIRTAYLRYTSIRIDANGGVRLETCDGEFEVADLLSGSVLLDHYAWLRFKTQKGAVFGELLRGNSRENQQWRRLQVIWRHIGAAS